MSEEVVEAAPRETSATGFDEDVVETVEHRRRNQRAEVAFPAGISEVGHGGSRRIRVTFELPYGDEEFHEEFRVDPDARRSVDGLLEAAGLDPEIDDIGMLDGRRVPIECHRDNWRVALTESEDASQQEPIVDGRETVATAGAIASVVSACGLLITLGTFALGTIELPLTIAVASVLVITRLLGEAVFAFGAAHGDVESEDQFSAGWERYLNDGDPSASGILFHLLTGGHLLD